MRRYYYYKIKKIYFIFQLSFITLNPTLQNIINVEKLT